MRLTPLDGAGPRLPEAPHVVQLAGIVGGCLLYRETGEALLRAGYRVALLDTAGDRRDDPAPGRLTWDFLAGEVVAGLDALGAERAILYGTSYGSLVALATAARFPARVQGVLLALNEPETSIHPALLEPLALLVARAASQSQVWITTHSQDLARFIEHHTGAAPVQLEKTGGETRVTGRSAVDLGEG